MRAPKGSMEFPESRTGFAEELGHASVLVIDDEPGMRNFLSKVLSENCAKVDVIEDTSEASRLMDESSYDVIVLDNIMPEKTGLQWLAEQREIGLFSETILITAHADLDTAIRAIRAGASDFLLKPFRSNQVLNSIARSLERARLRRQNSVLRHELEVGQDLLTHRNALIGSSPEIQQVRHSIEKSAKLNANVVIHGEAGSGRQVAARMLHAASHRADYPFVWLPCNGMTETTFRERLFGQLNSGLDGSVARQDGILRSASGGTLYLEDVEMLSSGCQNLLTEMLSTGRFSPLGASRSVEVNMRIVSSTTRPLADITRDGAFRADLFYRLTVIEIVQPPLRERNHDILDMITYFSNRLATRMGVETPELTPLARRRFLAHNWPGNVMELRNTIERALIRGSFEEALEPSAGTFRTESLASVEQRHILAMLETCNGNRAEAARRLGVARKTIDRKCQAWGL
ncbi:MAG: sigma-54 dependent transcriptional regulator [Pseudomonadota bacterium]